MITKKQFLVLVGLVVSAVIVVTLVLLITRFRRQPARPALPVVENLGPGTVVIDNTSGLKDLLLSREATAVENALIKYIKANVGKEVERAVIVGRPMVANNGLLSFVVRTESPNRQFTVTVDRSDRKKITFSVPASEYSETIVVYGLPGD